TTSTSFSDTGLTNATSYSYRVRANDVAGNLSGYSNTASASTPDTQAPTAPGTLSATAASSTQINLAWTNATDNVGISSYSVERCATASCTFAPITSTSALSFGDSGLTGSTSYSYRVRALDAAGNPGPYSNTAVATT